MTSQTTRATIIIIAPAIMAGALARGVCDPQRLT